MKMESSNDFPAVAVFIFNRPELASKLLEILRRVRPSKLYVISDGSRIARSDDLIKVQKSREVFNSIDWECNVQFNYSDRNLGSKWRIISGIEWVLSQEEMAIFLEDDCLPDESFFIFCNELLKRYKLDLNVGMISGNNFISDSLISKNSYTFSNFYNCWGWATWSNRWFNHFDPEIKSWPKFSKSEDFYLIAKSFFLRLYWRNIYTKIYKGEMQTAWDYQWMLANWSAKRVSIVPSFNLVSNVGFGEDATHTTEITDMINLPSNRMKFPLIHPKEIHADNTFDCGLLERLHGATIRRKIKLLILYLLGTI